MCIKSMFFHFQAQASLMQMMMSQEVIFNLLVDFVALLFLLNCFICFLC